MTDPLALSPLPLPMLSSPAMRAVVDGRARLQRMLDFEAALARAAAAVGAIPAGAAGPIVTPAKAERFDLAAIAAAAAAAGNIAVPLVAALAAEVAKHNVDAAGFGHCGASSQEAINNARRLEL